MIIAYVMLAFLFAVLVIGLYIVFFYIWKNVRHGWTAFVGLRRVHINVTVVSKYQNKEGQIGYEFLGMFPTCDDPQLITMAAQIKALGGSTKHQARNALALVQQCIRYVHDSDQYGEVEFWALPWQTIRNRKGDCEDSAFLYAGLLYNMGIKAIVVHLDGHVTVGVDLGTRHGAGFEYGGTFYTLAEPVRVLPLFGILPVAGVQAHHIREVEVPSQYWLSMMKDTI